MLNVKLLYKGVVLTIRSEDIARIIGVSRSTVSRVLNNYPDISEVTRQKVLKAIKEYNYYPNSSARRLAGAKNKTFGVFVIDIKDNESPHHSKKDDESLIYDNMYFAPFINAFIDQVNKKDYHVLVSTIYSNEDFKKIENVFRSGRIDGGIFIGSRMIDNKYIESLIDEKFLIGIIDSDLREIKHKNVICANIDNIKGASDAIDYLVNLGHKNIGVITGDLDKLSGIQRFEGSKNALIKHGISISEEAIAYGDFSEMSGYKGMKKVLAAGNRLTAVFICNDTMALGAYRALFERKLKIPDDMSIISFDDIQISKYISPPLTTVHFSIVKMASQLSSALIDSVVANKVKLRNILIETKIIARESCKKNVNE